MLPSVAILLTAAFLMPIAAAQAIDHPIDHVVMGVPIPVPDARYFLSGGICAAASHGVTTPVDVVKTRIQADPDAFQGKSLPQSAAMITQQNGLAALLGGLGPTIIGYGLEGAAKFGLYESLKPIFAALAVFSMVVPEAVTTEVTSAAAAAAPINPAVGFLGASVTAGAVASLLLVPLERTRIRIVTDPSYASNLLGALSRMWREEGPVPVLLGGFPAMLSKQVPYTFFKQVSFDVCAAALYAAAAALNWSADKVHAEVSLAAAFCASILACIASHPGDVILTDTYKKGGVDHDDSHIPKFTHVVEKIYQDQGLAGFFAGIQARFLHVGAIITSQLVLYDFVKQLLGLPATGT
jgi:solute carrier family 25 phosphate transporter 3